MWSNLSPKSARSTLSKATKELKDPVELYLSYGKWQEQIGQLVEARRSYEVVLGEDPKAIDAILGLARIDQLAGRTAEAEQGFLKATRLKPDHSHALDSLGQFYASQERWDLSVEALNSAMMAAPEHPLYRYHLGLALARSDDTDGAMPHLAKTVGDAAAHYNVGYILYEKGQLADAQQQFLQAIIKNPELQQAHTMLDEVKRLQEDKQIFAETPTEKRSLVAKPKQRRITANSKPHLRTNPKSQILNPQSAPFHWRRASAPQDSSPGLHRSTDNSLRSQAGPDLPPQAPRRTAKTSSAVAVSPQQLEQWWNQQ